VSTECEECSGNGDCCGELWREEYNARFVGMMYIISCKYKHIIYMI